MKKLIPILLLVFLLTACGQKEIETGNISEVEQGEAESQEELAPATSEQYFNNGFVGLSFPIPEGFSVDYREVNVARLTNGTQTIYLEHKTTGFREFSGINVNEEVNRFNGVILIEPFTINGISFTRMEDQVPGQRETDVKEIQDDDYIRLRYDFPIIRITGDSNLAVSESRYYIFNHDGSTAISIVGPANLFEESGKILDSMVESIKPYSETLDKTKEITIGSYNINIPVQFLSIGNYLYLVPSVAQSTYSGSFIYLRPGTLDEITPEDIMKELFPEEMETIELQKIQYPLNSLFGYSGNCKSYSCSFYRTGISGQRMFSHMLAYTIDMIEIDGETLIVGYPNYANKGLGNILN
ncbi:MAG: hypothetical protein IK121_11515 [Lachnospiraceae bacterium]|nr:hypothetical protein [Lachnospiraceae bacterium]